MMSDNATIGVARLTKPTKEDFNSTTQKIYKTKLHISPEVIPTTIAQWFQSRVFIPGYTPDMWVDQHSDLVTAFVENPAYTHMIAYMHDDGFVLHLHEAPPTHVQACNQIQYFLKLEPSDSIKLENIENCIMYGCVNGKDTRTLLNMMNNLFLPYCLNDRTWSPSIRREFCTNLHKFMASLTEVCHHAQGNTVLYVPEYPDENTIPENPSDVLQRVEALIIFWTRQVKEIINHQNTSYSIDTDVPLDEIQLWERRTTDLRKLRAQLNRPDVRTVIDFLVKYDSHFVQEFFVQEKLLEATHNEARTCARDLSVLIVPCERLSQCKLEEIPSLMPLLFNTIRVIWQTSQYFNTQDKITSLLRKLTTQLTRECAKNINIKDLLHNDPHRNISILRTCIEIGQLWQNQYKKCEYAIARDPNCATWTWNASQTGIFAQIDALVQRCGNLIEISQSILQFARPVPQISSGRKCGISILSNQCNFDIDKALRSLRVTFLRHMQKLELLPYDPLNVTITEWHVDFAAFKSVIRGLELMLSNTISTLWDNSITLPAAVDIFETLDTMAVRPAIIAKINEKLDTVFSLYDNEMRTIKTIYSQQRRERQPGIYAPYGLQTETLLLRAATAFSCIERLQKRAPEHLYNEAVTTYINVAESLSTDLRSLHGDWVASVIDSSDGDGSVNTLSKKLDVPLFTRPNPDKTERAIIEKARLQSDIHTRTRTVALIPVQVNIDPSFTNVIKETRIWSSLSGDFPIPYPAIEASEKENELSILRTRAIEVANTYNSLIQIITMQEKYDGGMKGLLDEYLHIAHKMLLPGLTKLRWDNDSDVLLWFLSHTSHKLYVLTTRLLYYRLLQARTYNACKQLSTLHLIHVDKRRVEKIESFEEAQTLRQASIIRTLRGIRNIIASHLVAMKGYFVNTENPDIKRLWIDYVASVDNTVTDALRTTVKRSLFELQNALYGERKDGKSASSEDALFEIELWLDNEELRIDVSPTLVAVSTVISKVTRTSTATIQSVPRFLEIFARDPAYQDITPSAHTVSTVAQAPKQYRSHYSLVLTEDTEILTCLQQIVNAPSIVAADLGKLITEIDQRYAPIWSVDKTNFMRRYMHSKRSTKSFEMDIQHYRNYSKDVAAEDSIRHVGFVRVHCEHLKHALTVHCVQWQQALTQLLHDTIISEMNAILKVCTNSIELLHTQPDTLDSLAEAVNVLNSLTLQFPHIKARYDPVREGLETLDKFDVHVTEEEKSMLQSVWRAIQNLQVMLIQTDRDLIQRKADVKAELEDSMEIFAQHVLDQRTELKETGPYSAPANITYTDVDNAMASIKGLYEKLEDSRNKAKAMHKGMDVFGIPHPEYKELDYIEQELGTLTKIWTEVKNWLNAWDSWSSSNLASLNADDIERSVSDFQHTLSAFDRSVKQWQVWRSLWAILQQFKLSLPLIGYLSSPAMRERHWAMLQSEIRSDVTLHANMLTMAMIYQLGIQHHTDTVTHIASLAQREFVTETQLKEIATVWNAELLDIVSYKQRYYRIRSVDLLTEKLEAHQLILTTHKNSIFFANFAKDITYWIQTLADIIETIDLLLQVQTQWVYLDNVISESADIGKQLPKEKELFNMVSGAWAEITENLSKHPRAIDLVTTLRADGLMERLTRMLESLDKINQKLDAFLETKRAIYPRFYFLANDDLLELLGQGKDPSIAHKHISKIFMGMKYLQVQNTTSGPRGLEVHGVVASDGEVLPLGNTVLIDGEVENWLRDVDKASSVALQHSLYKALAIVQKLTQRNILNLTSWIKSSPGQILLLSAQLGWTMRSQLALQESIRSKSTVRKMYNDWQEYVVNLTKMVRGDLDKEIRAKINALTVIEVHHRDVLGKLKSLTHTKAPLQSFDWTSLLRFYCESKNNEIGKCFAKQGNASFPYGYEYQGNSGRLVITPLTDRAYMTMTNALSLVLGCNPQGPAGTGKTETVKDLGKNLGRFVLVFNCTPLMDTLTIGRNLSGLSQTGFWGCFDEFNRIQVDVLAVIAQQLSTIFDALRAQKSHFNFQGRMLPLDSNMGIFVTMNPSSKGYAGRSELPENLKSLFRPIAMMVPDSQLICEIILLSEGFTEAATLARKVVTVYRFVDLQLSKQSHYSYGLRALKAVLARAGSIARELDNIDDEIVQEQILYRALGDMNRAALVPQDQVVFDTILNDIFLDTNSNADSHKVLRTEIIHQYRLAGLQATAQAVDKTLQLYESLTVRHGNMLVGDSLSGKSTAWKILSRAITSIHARQTSNNSNKLVLNSPWRMVEALPLNPKAVTTDELYGFYTNTGEWQDGVLAAQVRKACNSARDPLQERWVVLDGPVDTLWIESMNSLLDDNKILTLVNQDRIPLPDNVRILFEVEDLHAASPATVSRCGMVYLSAEKMGWKPYMVSWLRAKRQEWDDDQAQDTTSLTSRMKRDENANTVTKGLLTREAIESIVRLIDKFVTPILQCFQDKQDPRLINRLSAVLDDDITMNSGNLNNHILKEHIPTSALYKVKNLTRIFDSVLNSMNGIDHTQDTGASYIRLVELWFMFSCIWGLCGGLDSKGRIQIDTICRELDSRFPATGTVFDCCVDVQKIDWAHWEDKIPGIWKPTVQGAYHKYVVITADLARMSFLSKWCLQFQQHVFFQGATGCGKSTIITHALSQLDPSKFGQVDAYLTKDMTTNSLYNLLCSKIEKRQRNTYGAAGSKPTLLLVVDDLTAPQMNEFGSQPVLELLRQLLEYKFMADLNQNVSSSHKQIVGLQMLSMFAPPSGARPIPSNRLISKAVLLNMNVAEDSSIRRMFRTILSAHLLTFDDSIRGLAPVLASATVDLCRKLSTELLPTPYTPHYVFTLRDIASVIRGIIRSDPKHTDTKEVLGKLWAHECIRIFGDRISNDAHMAIFKRILTNIASDPRGLDIPHSKIFTSSGPIVFSDILSDDSMLAGTGLDTDANRGLGEPERMPYTDISEKNTVVKTYLEQRLQEFNTDATKQPQNLVFFDAALKSVLNAYRTLSQPRANLMLIGVGGSGRHSVGRMGAYLAGLQVRTIHPGPKYDLRAFRDEIKTLYKDCAIKRNATALLVSDDKLTKDVFYQDLSSLCLHGYVHNLFTPDEMNGLFDDLRVDAQRNNVSLHPDSLLSYLIARFRAHFHLIICLSPSDAQFASRCADYASLFSTCTVQSFSQWPRTALEQVAQVYLTPYLTANTSTQASKASTANKQTRPIPNSASTNGGAAGGDTGMNINTSLPSATGVVGADGYTVFPPVPSLIDLTTREGQGQGMRALMKLSCVLANIHEQSCANAEYMSKTGRVNHITPTKYLDLLATYMHLLKTKHADISKSINRLHTSIAKLESTQASVTILGLELEEKTKAAALKKVQCDKLLVEIMQKQRQADQQRIEVEAEAEKCREEAQETMRMKLFAQGELDKVTPSLEKAIRALEKLTKQAVTEVKSYSKPPKPVEIVMCAVMTILEKEPSWANAKKQLSDPNFLHKLKHFEKDKISNATLKAINKYTRHKDFNADDISNVSVAAGALCDWVCAMEMYAKVYRDVQPRRDALALAEQKLESKTQQLLAAQQQLEEVAANVGILESRYRESVEESRFVEEETRQLQTKLQRARAVVEGLSDKRSKWDTQLIHYSVLLNSLLSDCIFGACYLVYMGPFTDKYREELSTQWSKIITSNEFAFSANFNVTNLFTTTADLNEWNVNGLPRDPYTITSGIIVQNATRAPFIIDPQQQAIHWLRTNEAHKGLITADMEGGQEWITSLTQAMVKGLPILLENVPSSLPALLDPVLSITAFTEPSHLTAPNIITTVHFNDMDVDVRQGFKLYLVNRENNPIYRPELAIRCTVVNFAVTQSALEQQMLSLLVTLEEPQLEAERSKLLRDVANDTRHITELEENILTLLGNAQGSLLEDSSLVVALNGSKRTESEITSKLAQAQIAAEHLESSRLAYQSCAVRAALCYFVLSDMSLLDPMYQFSLAAYNEVFTRSVINSRNSKQHVEISARVAQITEVHTNALYNYAASAFNETHKLVFAFHLCLSKLAADNLVETSEISFLIRGPTLLTSNSASGSSSSTSTGLNDSANTVSSPVAWLSNDTWQLVLHLEQLPAFAQLSHAIERNHQEWEQWVKSMNPTPEKMAPPGKWQGKKSELHHLLLLRVLRPDRLIPGIRAFVAASFDKSLVETPKIDMNEIYTNSSVTSPILFFLQPGTDAGNLNQMYVLAQTQQVSIQTISLGRGQQHPAAAAIINAATQGTWIHIANLHLLPAWLPSLQRLIHAISAKSQSNAGADANPGATTCIQSSSSGVKSIVLNGHVYKITKVNPKFRLFLSTQPTNAIPQSLLQVCTKISLQPPSGMKSGMYRLFTSLSDQDLVVPTKPGKYRRMVYSLAWLHCLLVERSRFKGLGWTRSYEFALNDFTVSQHILQLECARDGDEVSWNGLRYLIGQCIYGGRVTDPLDRKLLTVLVQQAINETIYDMRGNTLAHANNANSNSHSGNNPASSPSNANSGNNSTSGNSNTNASGHNNSGNTANNNANNNVYNNLHNLQHAPNAFTTMPEENTCVTIKDFLKDLRKLPNTPDDECVCIFGQHSNAIVAAQRDEAFAVLDSLTILNGSYIHEESMDEGKSNGSSGSGARGSGATSSGSTSGNSNDISPIELTIQYILASLPNKLDSLASVSDAAMYEDAEGPSLISMTMNSEIKVLNELCEQVAQDLEQVKLAVHGKITLSDYIKDIWSSINLGKTPSVWKIVPHIPDSLSAWLVFIREVSMQLSLFIHDENTKVPVNPGRLFYPKAYFACVERIMMQSAPLSRGTILVWYLTPVITPTNSGHNSGSSSHTNVTQCFLCQSINGESVCSCTHIGKVSHIYVENGHWDTNAQCLSEPVPLELYHELPIMKLTPVFKSTLQLPRYMVQLPMYTHASRNVESYIMDVCVMANNKDHAHWIKRSTGFLLTPPTF